jgi:predicted small lipoprotein YifL
MPRLILTTLLACLTLAGCGADGPPQAPASSTPPPGLTISGDARIGIVSN